MVQTPPQTREIVSVQARRRPDCMPLITSHGVKRMAQIVSLRLRPACVRPTASGILCYTASTSAVFASGEPSEERGNSTVKVLP